MVQRAQAAGRYERLAEMRLITRVTGSLKTTVKWIDRNGVLGGRELSRLDWVDRQSLFLEGPDGPEPAYLWLTEQGLPMAPERWNAVFRTANLRCEQVLLNGEERALTRDFRLAEARGKSPYATPHSTRHSAAL
ncbi:hypothetical protein ABZX65_32945 [Streptomyces sp. NPDC003300]|uniref:hypothetical protein n=1 Tax=unclassified Streptomyces TaxID=2593676 RepID=UPI0033B8EF5A